MRHHTTILYQIDPADTTGLPNDVIVVPTQVRHHIHAAGVGQFFRHLGYLLLGRCLQDAVRPTLLGVRLETTLTLTLVSPPVLGQLRTGHRNPPGRRIAAVTIATVVPVETIRRHADGDVAMVIGHDARIETDAALRLKDVLSLAALRADGHHPRGGHTRWIGLPLGIAHPGDVTLQVT